MYKFGAPPIDMSWLEKGSKDYDLHAARYQKAYKSCKQQAVQERRDEIEERTGGDERAMKQALEMSRTAAALSALSGGQTRMVGKIVECVASDSYARICHEGFKDEFVKLAGEYMESGLYGNKSMIGSTMAQAASTMRSLDGEDYKPGVEDIANLLTQGYIAPEDFGLWSVPKWVPKLMAGEKPDGNPCESVVNA